jgi:hypothetical protein
MSTSFESFSTAICRSLVGLQTVSTNFTSLGVPSGFFKSFNFSTKARTVLIWFVVCDDKGLPAHHIENSSEIRPEWFEGIEHVGITAGTSTPSYVIEDVYQTVLKLEQNQKSAALSS